jgi:hypothetical protein
MGRAFVFDRDDVETYTFGRCGDSKIVRCVIYTRVSWDMFVGTLYPVLPLFVPARIVGF